MSFNEIWDYMKVLIPAINAWPQPETAPKN